jgi:hypothetical protein
VCDASGQRLAKRTGALAIAELRRRGHSAEDVLTEPLEQLLAPPAEG